MNKTTSTPSLADAIRAALSSRHLSIDFDHNRTPEGMEVRASLISALPRAEAADALAEEVRRAIETHTLRETNAGDGLRAALRRYRGAK